MGLFNCKYINKSGNKLDGVGPVNIRPSFDKLQNFVQKKKKEKKKDT